MFKRTHGVLLQSLLLLCLCSVALSPVLAQNQGLVITNDAQNRAQEIQRVIDRSNAAFQVGEQNFKDGNYDQARRNYDKAVDLVLESGYDVRSDARLGQYYHSLVTYIYQRQMALMKAAPTPPAPQNVAESTTTATAQTQTPKPAQEPAQTGDRGFGQQTYTPSPLNEITELKLTEDETKDASEAAVQTAVATTKLDFNFRPNGLIQSFINYYQGRGRTTMENGLRRSGRFMTMARRIFKEEGVPQDLAWLGQVESAWSPMARSWAAAVGLWQFIPETGKRFGLDQDYYVDERSSFEKATRASARYLKFLANRYAGNWELAMAAYNSGEGRVDGAISRSGYADFWEIYSRGLLPNETRNYVPNILATIIIAKNQARYGFSVKPEAPLAYDHVTVNNAVDLRLVADAVDSTYDYLLALNPELKRGMTPPGVTYPLRVPPGKGKTLQLALSRIPPDKRSTWRMTTAQAGETFDTIARRTGVSESALEMVNGGVLRPGQKVIVPANGSTRNVVFSAPRGAASATTAAPAVAANGSAKIVAYKVRDGETLGDIAGRYNTSVRDVATLNRLSPNSKLRAGQMIKVPVKSGR